MIGPRIKAHLERVGEPLFRRIHEWGVSPNTLTFTGLGINAVASLLLWAGQFTLAGLVMLAAGLFDMLDGGVARVRGGENCFGAFLDSMVDRYSDLFLLMGALLFYARTSQVGWVGLCCLAILGTVLVPYARARAECFLPKCEVGWMERPERIIVLAAGALFHGLEWAILFLVVFTHITVFQRIRYCWKHLSGGREPLHKEGKPL
jgi:CDP-diacylglycerol--glycerol-3-phosphate 3-phosphatidyltransferase